MLDRLPLPQEVLELLEPERAFAAAPTAPPTLRVRGCATPASTRVDSPCAPAARPLVEAWHVDPMLAASAALPSAAAQPAASRRRAAPRAIVRAADDPYLVFASRFMGVCAAAGLLGLLATWLTHF